MPDFKYTDKQYKLLEILRDKTKRFILVDGGSRSGKTVGLVRWMIIRCIKYPGTRRLLARKSKQSCKISIWTQTLLPMLSQYYKGIYTAYDDKIVFRNGSEIWRGGFDNPTHEDDVLGQEWADIYINEGTDSNYEIYGKLRTRLNISPEYKKEHNFEGKMVIDCNPKGSGHWLNKHFIKHFDLDTGKKLTAEKIVQMDRISFHPLDNRVNLDPKYLADLESQTGKNKARFWDGEWADNVTDAVYEFDRSVNVTKEPIAYQPHYETICSMDFGVSDATFIIWYQIIKTNKTPDNPKGIIINIIDEYKNSNEGVKHYANKIFSKQYERVTYYGDPSGRNRNESLESWISVFANYGINIMTKTYNSRSDLISNANSYMPMIRMNEEKVPMVTEMFINWELELDKNNRPRDGVPIHNEWSHPGTAHYFMMWNRFPTYAQASASTH